MRTASVYKQGSIYSGAEPAPLNSADRPTHIRLCLKHLKEKHFWKAQ